VVVVVCGVGFLLNALLSGDSGPRKKTQIQTVKLLNPSPPPPPKVEPKPLPEVKPKETFKADKFEAPKDAGPPDKVEKPRGEDLGLDAQGTAGSDAFGLKGVPGGSSIIGGGGGSGGSSPMGQYAWYARIIQDELREAVQKNLSQNGGIPKGKFETVVKIVLDDKGSVIKFEIMNSSGDNKMDEAVKATVKGKMFSQRPPEGMPHSLSVKVSTQA
jgi:TonB family protein